METFFNVICNICIDIMLYWEKVTPFTYGEINVFLFIILEPLLIMLFIGTTVFNYKSNNDKLKKSISIFAMITLVVLIVLTVFFVCFPFIDGLYNVLTKY